MTADLPTAGEGPRRPFDVDVVQPFQLDRSNLRGRLVRAGAALDEILTRHAYPEPVARLLGETITLAVALATSLKYEGIFTLQTKGDGPVAYTVADVTSVGDVRGYASFDPERLAALDGPRASVGALLGKGYLAFTVDQGDHTERYQGIVELVGDELDDSVRHYFRQSEQLATGLKVAVGRDAEGRWTGGALLLQSLPQDQEVDLEGLSEDRLDGWRRALTLLGTCTDGELLDPELAVNDLLFRLFHEERVRVYTRQGIRPGCRCSRDRVRTVLRSIPRADLDDMTLEDGSVVATCEFCNTAYALTAEEVETLFRGDA